jgi:hypothetical protein
MHQSNNIFSHLMRRPTFEAAHKPGSWNNNISFYDSQCDAYIQEVIIIAVQILNATWEPFFRMSSLLSDRRSWFRWRCATRVGRLYQLIFMAIIESMD